MQIRLTHVHTHTHTHTHTRETVGVWFSTGKKDDPPVNSRRTLSAPHPASYPVGGGQLKCDGTRAETRFRLWAKRTCPFKSVGASIQSTTGSWWVRISGSNAGYTMFRGNVKSTGYPLHSPVSPSLPLLCVTVCHHISTRIYQETIFRVRAVGKWGYLSHTTSAQTNNAWSRTSTSPFIFMARSFNEHWDNFPVNFNWYTGN